MARTKQNKMSIAHDDLEQLEKLVEENNDVELSKLGFSKMTLRKLSKRENIIETFRKEGIGVNASGMLYLLPVEEDEI